LTDLDASSVSTTDDERITPNGSSPPVLPIPPGEIALWAMNALQSRWTLARMGTGWTESTGRHAHRYRITVRAQLTQTFVEPLEHVVVQSCGDESILHCEAVDQAKLQAIFSWLYERGVEIVSVAPVRP
jgi:hypothetical protein